VLKENFKYKSVRIKKRVKLTASQKDHRLKTAKFQLENMVNIENVAFSDEKRFLLDPRPEHYDYVWTDNIHEESVFCDTPKYSSGSVEVWRAIIFYGKVDLVFIERPIKKKIKKKFTAQNYVDEILAKRIPQLNSIFKRNGYTDW
jgi:hypothetical protein